MLTARADDQTDAPRVVVVLSGCHVGQQRGDVHLELLAARRGHVEHALDLHDAR
jgi:hypothetical protein